MSEARASQQTEEVFVIYVKKNNIEKESFILNPLTWAITNIKTETTFQNGTILVNFLDAEKNSHCPQSEALIDVTLDPEFSDWKFANPPTKVDWTWIPSGKTPPATITIVETGTQSFSASIKTTPETSETAQIEQVKYQFAVIDPGGNIVYSPDPKVIITRPK